MWHLLVGCPRQEISSCLNNIAWNGEWLEGVATHGRGLIIRGVKGVSESF